MRIGEIYAERSERGAVMHAIEQLEYAKVKVLGFVLNGLERDRSYYGYSKKRYKRYYGYGKYGYGIYSYGKYGGYGKYGYGKYGHYNSYGESEQSAKISER